ncbi:hypothetical protein BHE74_00008683, partial [Ensete ventricosum]
FKLEKRAWSSVIHLLASLQEVGISRIATGASIEVPIVEVREQKSVHDTFKTPQPMIIPARELVQVLAKDEEMDLHFLADKDLGLSSVDHNTELMSNSISWSSPSLDVDIRFVLLLGWIRTRLKIKVARSVWLFRSLEHRMEFKLNPNAKSFTPLSSMRLHTAVSDGSIYYPSNATAVPHMHGLPIGVGVGPSFGHQPVLYNPQAPPMQSSQAYVHPSGPMSFSSSFAVWTADDCWAASTILLCAELSTCK